MTGSLEAGAERFSGFADLYDGVRPLPPTDLGDLLSSYLGGTPSLVVDLGSGTGLSTRWASTWAKEVIGIEPSDDMRTTAGATEAPGPGKVSYRAGWSHETGLPTAAADAIIVVQALHWMEPRSTLAEIERCLRPGGVFAAIDCDWPPIVGDWTTEAAWDACRRRMRVFETRLADGAGGSEIAAAVETDDAEAARYSGSDAHDQRLLSSGVRSWSKSEHLQRMVDSGHFSFCRDIAMASADFGTAERLIGLLRSQGDYQTLRRHGIADHELGVDRFAEIANSRLGSTRQPWRFVYRVRLGFKAEV
ncbi:MAG TPA: class I SAM-dependent methyltransferase [Acidimicrobiales bacterium]|nr:class I SAM-dependent methyltransferase [Acidimicrobiales bacterium]